VTIAVRAETALPEVVDRPGPAREFAVFCYRYIRHTKGIWAGLPFTVEEWQREFLDEALRVEDGKRVYREVLLGLPRKNGKSTLAASLALYMLVADDEPGPEVYAAAAAQLQAGIVFQQAKDFVAASPALRALLEPMQYRISFPRRQGFFRLISSDAPKQHGLNPSAVIIDELHAHENGDLYVALMTGSGARRQPLTLSITTAGYDEESILGQLYNRALALPDLEERPGLTIARDPRSGFLMFWYGAPKDASLDDPEVWRTANPASWLRQGDYLEQQRHAPGLLDNDRRRFHLNQWVESEQSWLPSGAWEACEDKAVALDPALPIGVGIDKGQTHDTAAVVVAQKQDDRVVVRARVWANPYPDTHRLHDSWEVSSEEIREHLRELHGRFPAAQARAENGRLLRGPAFAYDPWHFAESAEMLEKERLNMLKFPQNFQRMGPASTQTHELIKGKRLVHDGDPVLAAHVRNATAELTPRGWKVSKPKKATAKKNDAAVALVMAVAMAMQDAPPVRKAIAVSF
jgi:phage terminase large subunit-like protein